MELIDGKAISQKVKNEVSVLANELIESGIKPTLAVVLVGEDKASMTYVAAKEKAAKLCNITSIVYRLKNETQESELLELIDKLNRNSQIHGILVQLPLPKHIDEKVILESILPTKDVDGFHPVNVGKLFENSAKVVSCTPAGIIRMLDEKGVKLEGKNVVVLGRSNIVGKPIAGLLINRGATVTICNSKTKNIENFTKNGEIVIVAIGKPHFLKDYMVSDGAIVIDVGINRLDDGKLVGDVDTSVFNKASLITPVPGGVGPMTIAMLLLNTVILAKESGGK